MHAIYSVNNFIFLLAILQFSISQRRIKNGFAVEVHKKYTVYLIRADVSSSGEDAAMRDYSGWLCGGAIVSRNFIVTSAACVENVPHIYAIAGYNKSIEYEQIDVDTCTKNYKKKVIFTCIPKNYKFDYNKTELWASIDIAVVKVESPYNFKDDQYEKFCSYTPAAISFNKESKLQDSGNDMIALGWGHAKSYRNDKDEKSYNEGLLRYAPVMIIDKNECVKYYKGNDKIPPLINKYMICTLGAGNMNDKGEIRVPTPNEKLKSKGCSAQDKLKGAFGMECRNEEVSGILGEEYDDIVVIDGNTRRKENNTDLRSSRKNNGSKRKNAKDNNGSSLLLQTNRTVSKGDVHKNRINNNKVARKNRTDNNEDARKNGTNSYKDARRHMYVNDSGNIYDDYYDDYFNTQLKKKTRKQNVKNEGNDDVNNPPNGNEKDGHNEEGGNEKDDKENYPKSSVDKDINNQDYKDKGQNKTTKNHDDQGKEIEIDGQEDSKSDSKNESRKQAGTGYDEDLLDTTEFGPGICQNDHGGPLVGWMGAHEILVGVATMFKLDKKLHCRGPYLFTSTYCNAAFLDCIISIDIDNTTTEKTRRACEESERQGYEIIERRLSWFDHPDGPAENEMIHERPQIPLSSFHRK